MGLIRKWFGGDTNDPSPAKAPVETPAEEPTATPEATEPPAQEAAPLADAVTDWWASSPHDAVAPPTNQSALVQHPADPTPAEPSAGETPAEPDPSDPSETPTAPQSVLAIAQAVAQFNAAAADSDSTDALEGTRQLDDTSAPAMVAQRSAQGFAAMAARDIGRVREINQDSAFAMIATLPREGSDMTVGLFIVADGMGGHHGGEIASRLAVRTVVQQVLSDLVLPTLDETMGEALQPLMISAVQEANRAIWEQGQAMGSDMGTTCTAVLLVGQGLYIAHVGDSRAYLYEPGGLRQLTTDHSTVGRLIQLGQLDPLEAREHPLRNQLYRTIGQQPQVPVDFLYHPIGMSSHLLLCSDGLWGMVDDAHIQQALGRSPWPQDACNELIALANLAGGEDNISAVVVSLPLVER